MAGEEGGEQAGCELGPGLFRHIQDFGPAQEGEQATESIPFPNRLDSLASGQAVERHSDEGEC